MNLFVMWMAGNSVSIFPVMMVGMMFMKPVQALIGYKEGYCCHIESTNDCYSRVDPSVHHIMKLWVKLGLLFVRSI